MSVQGKEILTFVVASVLTLAVSLPVIRYFAPQLIGLPMDLQMVQVAAEVPPYFENVFRDEDFDGDGFIIQDPYIQRARPLFLDGGFWGPHDLLGFRNPSIPAVADVITLGDSMTYGMGTVVSQTWPRRLEDGLAGKRAKVYNMSLGGWGAAEYLNILPRALRFRPRVVVVAFYTGNDPRDTFSRVYSRPDLAHLRLDPDMQRSDLPPVTYPAPKSEHWEATFQDGTSTVFTAKVRHGANLDHPSLDVAYEIMAEVARRIQNTAAEAGAQAVFTVLPTKEQVLAPRLAAEGITAPDDFQALVRDEKRHLDTFAERLRAIPDAVYVDMVTPLQLAALDSIDIYPPDFDGHPTASGHRVIQETLQPAVDALLPAALDGVVRVVYEEDEKKEVYSKRVLIRGDGERLFRFLLVRDGKLWRFRDRQVFEANGWSLDGLPSVTSRDVAGLPYGGTVDTVEPARFGPR